MNFDTVIGLEVHAELKTNSKCFCTCENSFGGAPNTHCCPVCIALPGALPVLNKEAVRLTIKAGHALGCKINDEAIFERKNYFYPDLAKAYQISQLVKPICLGGGIQTSYGLVRLNRIHLEEDAGKLIHESSSSLIDYNRAGVPLIEIVTEPDITCKEQAIEFLTELRSRLVFADVAECKMQEGGMRCDVNLSLKEKGSSKLGTRTEMKNLNSFRSVERAISYEENRQKEVLEEGGRIVQNTLRWDDDRGVNYAMRSKEESEDYRYFPDPDLLTVIINPQDVKNLKDNMPKLPEELRKLFTEEYSLPEYDANILTSEKEYAAFFEETLKLYNNPKAISNFIMTDILLKLKDDTDGKIKISATNLASILKLIEEKKITRTVAKEILPELWGNSIDALKLIQEKNLISNISDAEIEALVDAALANNAKAVEDYKNDRSEKILRFFVGQVMKETKGKANAELVIQILNKKL